MNTLITFENALLYRSTTYRVSLDLEAIKKLPSAEMLPAIISPSESLLIILVSWLNTEYPFPPRSYTSIYLSDDVIIGEEYKMTEFVLLHAAYLMMQIEIGCICFGISAFIRRGSIGIGLGLALTLYFMNIICNISDKAEALKYITPYAYAEASNIISEAKLDIGLIAVGAGIAVIGAAAGYLKYLKKDIAS